MVWEEKNILRKIVLELIGKTEASSVVLWMMDLMLGVTMKEGPVVFGDGLRNTGTEDQGVTVTWVGGSQDEGQDGGKLKECPSIDWVRTRIVGVKMIGELKMKRKRHQRTGKWIRKIRSCGEGCRNCGRSQESHGEERADNNAISTDDHRLLNTLMLKDDVVRQDEGQEAVQGDQHVQREEQEDDDHSCSNLEDNFAEEKVFNNQESFRLAENKLYNKLVSCTTTPATNWGREGRRHISKNKYRI